MPSVLFVCTANLCRSPMASAIFKGKITQLENAAEWRVESAGTWAVDGLPAAQNAQLILASELGLDIKDHRSRGISREILDSFDLILTMERGHKEALQVEFPDLARKIYLLSEMANANQEIRDPIGGNIGDYRDTINELDRLLKEGFDTICRLAEKRDPGDSG